MADENVIAVIEEAIRQFGDEMDMVGMFWGRIGARVMAVLEDDEDFEGGDENWERVTVNVDDYRRMGDPSFRRHFRLPKETFESLLVMLANYLVDSGRVQRVRTPLAIPLLMVLWVLANPDTFRSVALRFGVLPGVVYFHYSYIVEALRELAPRYIQWPNEEERAVIKRRFEEYSGFPGIVGVIDGTYNIITAPTTQKVRYLNRHHQFSLNTSVVCDHDLLIRDINVGEVGSLHDQRVFRRSPLYEKLLHNENEEHMKSTDVNKTR